MDRDLIRRGYDEAAEDYATNRNLFENKKYLEKLNELLRSNSTILDIGCGAGRPVDEFFIQKGHKVVGIDISDKMIEIAKKNVPSAEYEVKDMAEMEEGEYKVDAVVSFYAIFHTDREIHQDIFRKINSFLPKDGLILVTMGSGEWEGEEDDFHGTTMQWSHYGVEKNKKIIRNAGFEILLDEVDGSNDEKHLFVIAKKV